MAALSLRLAIHDDVPDIQALMERSIRELQKNVLSERQIEASFAGMGLDTQLIKDETYFAIMDDLTLVGCGGWSRRATLYGGNHSVGRNARLLDPETEPARIRAMYTHPEHTRRGIGRMILEASETAARAEGFKNLTMVATMAGKPFYQQCGYCVDDEWEDENGEVPVPLATMSKLLI